MDKSNKELCNVIEAALFSAEMPLSPKQLKLLFPKSTYPLAERLRLQAEAHQKILTPLLVLVLILIGGFCLMRGQFSRKGLLPRIIYAVCGALGTQGSVLFLLNQSAKFPMAVAVNYVFIALFNPSSPSLIFAFRFSAISFQVSHPFVILTDTYAFIMIL